MIQSQKYNAFLTAERYFEIFFSLVFGLKKTKKRPASVQLSDVCLNCGQGVLGRYHDLQSCVSVLKGKH